MFQDRFVKGEIMWIDFGSIRNGSELIGKHWAVVVEIDNNPKVDTVVCVPLSSRKEYRHLRPHECELGNIIPGGKSSVALVSQITRISKQRIISRSFLNGREELYLKVTTAQMKAIEDSLIRMLIGQVAA